MFLSSRERLRFLRAQLWLYGKLCRVVSTTASMAITKRRDGGRRERAIKGEEKKEREREGKIEISDSSIAARERERERE